MKEFNVNNYVKVKLTETGIDELKKQHDRLIKLGANIGDFKPPQVDKDGYTKYQLHDLMSSLGHLMHIGFGGPFETTILIDL